MVRDVETEGFLLPLQACAIVVFDIRELGFGRGELGRVEHRELVLARPLESPRGPLYGLRVNLDHGGPGRAFVIEGAALYEGLERTLVVGLGIDALAKVEDVLEGTVFPGGDDRIHTRVPDVLDRRETETDSIPDHGEAASALV